MSRPPTPDDSLDTSPPLPQKPNDNRHLGLVQVHPKTTDDKEISKKKVDIIFMHGLDAQSPKTWIAWVREDDPNSGNVNWLSDEHMLPAAMPDARILTYDWNSNYDRTASRERLVGHADALLERISRDREDFNRHDTPLMFVASCYSGLLLAQALVRATEIYLPRHKNNRRILDSVAGIAFLGTPFGGSWETGYLVANLRLEMAADAATEYNRELIEYLRPGTRDTPSPLQDLIDRFTYMIRQKDFNFGIVCFYETRDTDFSPYKSKLSPSYAGHLDENGHGIVVEKASACLQGVDKVALDVRHNMLHKFNSPQNEGFKHLTSRLREFQGKAVLDLSTRAKLHDICLEALYFGGINFEPGQIREASETTCQWLLEHPVYSNWHGEGHGVFWILGGPGTGKSTIIKHAIKKDQGLHDQHSTITLSFFFHNQGKRLQHTVEGLLRGLLRQLLERVPGHMHTFCKNLDTETPKGLHDSRWAAPYLVKLFEEALAAVLDHVNIRVFVDALDECRVGEEEDDTKEIEELVQKLRDIEEVMRAKPQNLSICFACRHDPPLAYLKKDPYIKTEWENGGAIEQYVQQELLQITGDDQLRSNLQTEIVNSANGNFLWASLVTAKAVRLHRKGLPVEEIICNTPREVSAIYKEILRRLSRETSEMSLKVFQWLCFAEGILTLRMFCFASGIYVQEPECSSCLELLHSAQEESDPRMERLIRTLSGGLAEVNGEIQLVVLIHQSVKDFLIKDGLRILDPKQDTHQKVMENGHNLLLSSSLWWLTEVNVSGVVEHWTNTFDPAIIGIVRNIDLSSNGTKVLIGFEFDDTRDERGIVDALGSSDREVMRVVLSEHAKICDSWSAQYREGMGSQEYENWLTTDEIFACFLLYLILLANQPSFTMAIYATEYWACHALKVAENDGLLTAKSEIRKFCSRLKLQYATIYNRIFRVLHVAAGLPESWVLEELLVHVPDSPLDVNSMSGGYGLTPLMEAIRKGRMENARILLAHEEIAVNAMNGAAQTALFSAVNAGSYELVERLINQGASLDIQDVEGETVLMWAVDHDQYEIMTLLLEKGASIHLESLNNANAIDVATDRCLDGLASFIIGKIKRQEREIWGDR